MVNDPIWLTNREATALAALQGGWDEDAVHIAANSPEQIIALCKLVRELGNALKSIDCLCTVNERLSGHRLDCDLPEEALEVYQRGPVTGEESGG